MTDLKAAAEAAKAAHAGGDLGAFSDAFGEFQRLATPSAVLALYAERDEAIRRGENQFAVWVKCDVERRESVARAEAAEASLALYKEEVERLKIALADAIRRPMGVIPASAEGLVTYADVAAAEERRADNLRDDLTKETPHAE